MPRSDSHFKKGNKLAKGGKRPNSGRPANWLQELCEEELDKRKITEIRAQIAAGLPITTSYKDASGKKVEIVRVPTLKDMQEAGDWLADRAAGKAPQSIKHSATNEIDFVSLIRQAEDERGLERTV